MTERHSRKEFLLRADDTIDASGFGLAHTPKPLSHNGSVLTRSIERPAVRAGSKCPRCSGSMFLENQMHDEPELVCQSCSYNEVPVDLPALLLLADEMADAIVPKKGDRKNHRRHPASNGVEL